MDLKLGIKRKDARSKIETERNRKLYVKGLPADITKAELNEYFSVFGQLDFANVNYSIGSTQPRGFGFIKFKTESNAEDALKFESHSIRGSVLTLKRSEAKRDIDSNKKSPNKIEPTQIISEKKDPEILRLDQGTQEKIQNQSAELNQSNFDENSPKSAMAQGPRPECPKSGSLEGPRPECPKSRSPETARPPHQPQISINLVPHIKSQQTPPEYIDPSQGTIKS